jgi:hypothetical protein
MRRSFRSFGLVTLSLLAACSAGADGVTVKGKPDDAGDGTGLDGATTGRDATTDRTSPTSDRTTPGSDAPTTTGDGAVPSNDGGTTGGDDAGTSGGDGGTTPGMMGCGTREVCGDGIDNDCNGVADNGCACVPGMTQRCYDGPPAQAGRGVCVWGMQTCTGTGEFGDWGACMGAGRPQPVVCGRMMDFRCNGNIDEGCACTPGATRNCYSGPMGTEGVGSCRPGMQTCRMTTTGSEWGTCTGEVLPGARDLCDGGDQDCDGRPNTNCTCVVNAARSCYSGPTGTQGVGACRAGTQRCVMTASGPNWNACTGEVLPSMDQCDGVDRNCDGNTNTGCTCMVGATRPCYSGPAGTSGVGVCRAGVQTCARAASGVGTTWGTACTGEVLPGPTEVCGNLRDDNCNGAVDEGCTTMRVCPDGYDLLNDPNNCGRCGNRCPAGEVCANGVCVGNGQLRVTMTWSAMGDMDLHVVPPCGTLIYYGALSACGGTLDVDSCPAGRRANATDPCNGPENIFWPAAPASGTYVVCAVPYQLSTAVNYTVTVTRGTTQIRRWTGTRPAGNNFSARCSRTSPFYIGDFAI